MIQVLHISAECYPAAKTGGLGDVVGSLPRYMSEADVLSAAIIPKYATKWINNRNWVTVYSGAVWVNWRSWNFSVQQETDNSLGFPFFVVDIPGLYDRPGIYNDPSGAPYGDEIQRYVAFQQAVLEWLLSFPWHDRPRVLHCHDHHSGLVPWMVKFCPAFRQLAPIPTVFTIHNGQYQGMFGWSNGNLLPPYEAGGRGYLEWNGLVNPMAAAIRCAWAVTTVSESYLYELHENSLGLEQLFRDEWQKEFGIVNGIDVKTWDPATDPMIKVRYEGDISAYKNQNKQVLCELFGFSADLPLISFIGRMVGEKGSDILPEVYKRFIHAGGMANFLVLGTGEAWTQNEFRAMAYQYPGRFNAVIDYNEALSHQIYAGSDYLIMPSRVEPCGLNQMYAMRYGAIPIVRSVGGLKDTVPDIGEPGGIGRGIRFDQFSIEDAGLALYRAEMMWHKDPAAVKAIRERIMSIDFSWEHAVDQYFNVYRRIGATLDTKETKRVAAQQASKPERVPKAKAKSAEQNPAPKKPAAKPDKPATGKSAGAAATPKTAKAAAEQISAEPPAVKPSKTTKKTPGAAPETPPPPEPAAKSKIGKKK